jgi:telomerase reverse transcriptase
MPLSELPLLSKAGPKEPPHVVTVSHTEAACEKPETSVRSPSAISFVRNRFLYARPILSAKGQVTFGLRHIHVLNRFLYRPSACQEVPETSTGDDGETQPKQPKRLCNTLHVMMYMFPRQFKLHNVFTATVDSRETVQPFKDYTNRGLEISSLIEKNGGRPPKVPRRLRGQAFDLVQKMQILHKRSSYSQLLQHYCPKPV